MAGLLACHCHIEAIGSHPLNTQLRRAVVSHYVALSVDYLTV
jgi:hypothetical protein